MNFSAFTKRPAQGHFNIDEFSIASKKTYTRKNILCNKSKS